MPATTSIDDLHKGGSAQEAALAISKSDFEELFRQHRDRVLAYALRRVDADVAKDVVADTFLVAWRRSDEVPDDPLPWLLGVARRIISTKRRGTDRRERLIGRLGSQLSTPPAANHDRLDLAEAFGALSDKDRETLMLIAWDGLTAHQAADVLGMTPSGFNVRLHRARKRLEAHMRADTPPTQLTASTEEIR